MIFIHVKNSIGYHVDFFLQLFFQNWLTKFQKKSQFFQFHVIKAFILHLIEATLFFLRQRPPANKNWHLFVQANIEICVIAEWNLLTFFNFIIRKGLAAANFHGSGKPRPYKFAGIPLGLRSDVATVWRRFIYKLKKIPLYFIELYWKIQVTSKLRPKTNCIGQTGSFEMF